MKKIIYSTLFIVLIAVSSALILELINDLTDPIIQKNRRERLAKFINTSFPGFDRIETNENTHLIYSGSDLLGYGVDTSSMGYSSEIEVFVLFDRDKKIKDVIITASSETPDIGNKILEEEFLKHFRDKTISDLNTKEMEVDAITGATISSTAVIEAVLKAGEIYYEE